MYNLTNKGNPKRVLLRELLYFPPPSFLLCSGLLGRDNRITENPRHIVGDSQHDKCCALQLGVKSGINPLENIGDVLVRAEDVQDLLVEGLTNKPRTLVYSVELLCQQALSILIVEDTVVFHGPRDRDTNVQAIELDRVIRYLTPKREVLELHLCSEKLGAAHASQQFKGQDLAGDRVTSGVGQILYPLSALRQMQVIEALNARRHLQGVPHYAP